MNEARQLPHSSGRVSREAVALYILPHPQRDVLGFCALVARMLRCRSCSISLTGPGGERLVEDSVGRPINLAGPARIVAEASISYPVALPDGTTGFLRVGDRIDGWPFGVEDLDLLEHLIAFYVSTFDAPARQETLHLRAELSALRTQAIRAQERERQWLARELHDDIGHALTTAILELDVQARSLPDGNASRAGLAAAREVLTQCANHLHEFAFHLRPRVLNDLGLMPALRSLARRVNETGAVVVELTVQGQERRLGDDTELAAFRIVQEALTNALKHARASRIAIDVAFTAGALDLEISDNGVGLPPVAADCRDGRHGQGLAGMRERAEMVGGDLGSRSRSGRGTTIWARLPMGERNHD